MSFDTQPIPTLISYEAHMHKHLLALVVLVLSALPRPAQAETRFATEEHFQDLFITAGYSTAFGAALGAAFLGLTDNPMENLRYVAFGASLGFIGGSLFGTYVLVAPALTFDRVDHPAPAQPPVRNLALDAGPARQLVITPAWNAARHRLDAVRADWVIGRF